MSTQEDILRAARELFVEEGVSKATMTAVARRADVSRQTAYNHFSSVDKLAVQVMTEEVIGLLTQAGAEDFSGSCAELIDLVLRVTTIARDNDLLNALIRQDPTIFATYQYERFGVSQKLILNFLRESLDQIAAEGQDPKLREGNHQDMAVIILMAGQAAALSRSAFEPELSNEDAWRDELIVLLEGYLYA